MTIITDIERIQQPLRKTVVAIGVFDGVHRGHRKLIKSAVARARKINGTSVVVTFAPHPVHVLRKHIELSLLVSLPHRLRLIRELGVQTCILINFTKRFSRLSPDDFVKRYLVAKLSPAEIFVGKNFHFGSHRKGSGKFLQQMARAFGFKVTILDPVKAGRHVVSSSRLRQLIASGRLSLAEKLLGRPLLFIGNVACGDGRGRRLGFPTANIDPGQEILPPSGIYLAHVFWKTRRYSALASIGYRPSFKTNARKNIEVHLLNFSRNIYGDEIAIRLLRKIRSEKKFSSPSLLVRQMEKDRQRAIRFFH